MAINTSGNTLENIIGTAIVSNYLKGRGFGTMTKNDFEILIFNSLLESGSFVGKTNFDISNELHIPESKVQRLMYEAQLVYGKNNQEVYAKLFYYLMSLSYDDNKKMYQIIVENKYDRLSIMNEIKKGHQIVDISFNSEIISFKEKSLKDLISKAFFENDSEKQKLVEEIKKQKKELNYDDILQKFLEGLAQGLGSNLGKNAITLFLSDFNPVGCIANIVKSFFK